MPSGYTAKIYNGEEVTGKEFVIQCARAFGATIMMKDEPMDKPIPEFEPDNYYLKSLKNEKEKLLKFQRMTTEEAQVELDSRYEKSQKEYYESIKKYSELESRYTRTLREVEAWQPPSAEHIHLKEYAIDQLKSSIENDCNTKYLRLPEREDAKTWLSDMIEHYQKNIIRYQKDWENEVQRTEERNQWIRQLKESL